MTETPPPPPEDPDRPPRGAWSRLARMGRPRWTKANVLALVLALILGFAVATQVQLNQGGALERLRQNELVSVLDQVTTRANQLDADVRRLEAARDTLIRGAGDSQAAITEAKKRLTTLGILAGTVPAKGRGVLITIDDPLRKVTAPALLDAIQELRDAGAEVIDISGVRIVASSAVTGDPGALVVDGTALGSHVVVTAIGDPSTMSTAMKIPGGVIANIEQLGGSAFVTESDALSVTSLHEVKAPRYARPVPDPQSSTSAP